MVFTAAGNVYLAFNQIYSKTMRDADNLAFTNYAGRMMVGSYSVEKNSMNWVNEQALYFGFSGALVYKNYCTDCSNLFVGGANDWSHVSSSTEASKWEISIVRLKEDGTAATNQVFHIDKNAGTGYENALYIDHMYLDDTTFPEEEWLFGSTRSTDLDFPGKKIYFWKVRLNPVTHDPDGTTLVCISVSVNN